MQAGDCAGGTVFMLDDDDWFDIDATRERTEAALEAIYVDTVVIASDSQGRRLHSVVRTTAVYSWWSALALRARM